MKLEAYAISTFPALGLCSTFSGIGYDGGNGARIGPYISIQPRAPKNLNPALAKAE